MSECNCAMSGHHTRLLCVGQAAGAPRAVPWLKFMQSSAVWAVIVAHFCFNYGYYVLLAWLPRCAECLECTLGRLQGNSCSCPCQLILIQHGAEAR